MILDQFCPERHFRKLVAPVQVSPLTDVQVHSGCLHSCFLTPDKLSYSNSVAGRVRWVYMRVTEPQHTNRFNPWPKHHATFQQRLDQFVYSLICSAKHIPLFSYIVSILVSISLQTPKWRHKWQDLLNIPIVNQYQQCESILIDLICLNWTILGRVSKYL